MPCWTRSAKSPKKEAPCGWGRSRANWRSGTNAAELYGSFVINERHRHRYEFNNAYREKFEKAGFVFSGLSPDGKLVEVIELEDHPFFIASQFHPEFLSKPHQPHPLFKGFIAAAHGTPTASRSSGKAEGRMKKEEKPTANDA